MVSSRGLYNCEVVWPVSGEVGTVIIGVLDAFALITVASAW
ncbi:hypothetical protein [Paenarthrobacter sp. DKR-5]|nr:hypothetical protein [Paenarthrobacter sp. DKR-5]